MQKLLLILVLLLVSGCNGDEGDTSQNGQEKGKLSFKITYGPPEGTKSADSGKTTKNNKSDFAVEQYDQFGDYLGSVTPTTFIGKFLDMRFQNWDSGATIWNYGFNVIDNNTPISSPDRLADFSGNKTVNFTLNIDGITFDEYNIFFFIPMFFYQEVELPEQYINVATLENIGYVSPGFDLSNDAIGGTREGNLVKGNNGPFMRLIFNNSNPTYYVFGETDSSFSYLSDGKPSINDPVLQGGTVIRSSKFGKFKIDEPKNGDTTLVNGNLTFDTNGLIQIYAGKDNLPYTSDDVFIYAPNWWDRLRVGFTQANN